MPGQGRNLSVKSTTNTNNASDTIIPIILTIFGIALVIFIIILFWQSTTGFRLFTSGVAEHYKPMTQNDVVDINKNYVYTNYNMQ